MKKIWTLFLAIGLAVLFCLAGTSANASTLLYEQDDFVLNYNNSPGEADTQFIVTGRLLDWNSNTLLYAFTLTGSNTNGAQHVGNEWITTYDNSTLTITPWSGGGVQWTGSGSIFTQVHDNLGVDGIPITKYPASDYPHPAYAYPLNPAQYYSVGAGAFTGAAGQPIADTTLYLPWFGTYNWNYGQYASGGSFTNFQVGNTQGQLSAVPEPATMLLLGSGLIGLAGYARKRFKK